jgi:hypothetical protein
MMDTPTEELVKDAFHNNNDVKWLKFPFCISDIDARTSARLLNDFTGKFFIYPNLFKSRAIPVS